MSPDLTDCTEHPSQRDGCSMLLAKFLTEYLVIAIKIQLEKSKIQATVDVQIKIRQDVMSKVGSAPIAP